MTDAFFRRVLDFSLGGCCALMLIGLVALTVADVIGRYVLNAPLPGAFELTELMLGALVFAALPIAAFSEEHVEMRRMVMTPSRTCRYGRERRKSLTPNYHFRVIRVNFEVSQI